MRAWALLAVHFPGGLRAGLPEVAHGQGEHLVAPGEHPGGALGGPPRFLVHLVGLAQPFGAGLPHGLRVGLGNGLGTFDDDGLQQLRTHHRAHPGAASRAALHAAHHRVAHQVLAALTDAEDAHALAVAGVDPLVGGVGALAPHVVRGQEGHLVVVDAEQGRALGPAFHDQGVVTGLAQLHGHRGAQVAVAVTPGHGRLGRDDGLAGIGRGDAGDGAQGDHELVLGAQGVDAGLEFVVQDLGGEAPAAEPLPGEFRREGLFPESPGGQVDAQDPAGPTIHDAPPGDEAMTGSGCFSITELLFYDRI